MLTVLLFTILCTDYPGDAKYLSRGDRRSDLSPVDYQPRQGGGRGGGRADPLHPDPRADLRQPRSDRGLDARGPLKGEPRGYGREEPRGSGGGGGGRGAGREELRRGADPRRGDARGGGPERPELPLPRGRGEPRGPEPRLGARADFRGGELRRGDQRASDPRLDPRLDPRDYRDLRGPADPRGPSSSDLRSAGQRLDPRMLDPREPRGRQQQQPLPLQPLPPLAERESRREEWERSRMGGRSEPDGFPGREPSFAR